MNYKMQVISNMWPLCLKTDSRTRIRQLSILKNDQLTYRHGWFMFAVAPPLKDVTQKDVEMYSSRSLPVATKAKQQHNAMLQRLQQPWWRQEWQDDELDEEEKDKIESEIQLLL